jgi:hypothetical protein
MSADPNDLVEHARRLATPVDVPALLADGVLRARGRWYEVLNDARLPEWARCQISAMRAEAGAVLVRFGGRNRAAERLYEELTGQRLDPHAGARASAERRAQARADARPAAGGVPADARPVRG